MSKKFQNRRKTVIALAITLVSVVVLVVSSYAWMSLSSSPTVSDLALTIVSDNALELAPDVDGAPGEWSSILDLSDPSKGTTVLYPVTVDTDVFGFSRPLYGEDGRIAILKNIRQTDRISAVHETSVAADAESLSQFIFVYDFYMRTESSDCIVSLSMPQQVDSEYLDGYGCFVVGEAVWNEETMSHDVVGKGAEYAIRIGFYIEGTAEHPGDTFVIYEPNANAGKDADGHNVNYDGAYRVIRQYDYDVSETDPVLKDSVVYSIGSFYDDNTDLFNLYGGEVRHITLFIWLEGEDRDCENAISEGQILANIQFTTRLNDEDDPIIAE